RGFLNATGALVAGHVLAAPSTAAAAPGDEIGIGIIGVGNRGSTLLKHLLAIPGVSLRAVCDNDAAHLERALKAVEAAGQHRPEGTADWKALLDLKGVDAVVSALPCDLHAANYLDVLEAGKDLYGEKPMCLTPGDCDKVVAKANDSKQIVQIGHQRRAD